MAQPFCGCSLKEENQTCTIQFPLNLAARQPSTMVIFTLLPSPNYVIISCRLETGIFAGRPADYAFLLGFIWICAVIVGLFMNIMVLMDPLVLAVLYIWCQLNKDTIVTFWFGTQFKAMYLPWVLFAFNLIIANGGVMELIGILIGHLYFFLMFTYPQDFGGPSLLSTPQFLHNWFPSRSGGIYGQAPSAPQGNNGDGGGGGGGFPNAWRGHQWGQGNRLGN